MEAVLARQRQAKAALFAKVLSEYRSWSRGETSSYVDGANVPSLRPSQLSVALVHDWAFGQLEGELGNGEEGAGEVRDWHGWVHLLSHKFKLPARHLGNYETLMRRSAEQQGRGTRRRRTGTAEGEGASEARGEAGGRQRRVDGGPLLVKLNDDILLLLREFTDSRDFNALTRTSKGVLQRTVSAVPLWKSLCFSTRTRINVIFSTHLEAAIRRSAGELHTLVLPEKLEENNVTILAKLAEEGHFDKLQRLCVPSFYWADALQALLSARPLPHLQTLVCVGNVLAKIGDVREKVYSRLPNLQRVHLRGGKYDIQPDPAEVYNVPLSSSIDSLFTRCTYFEPTALSPRIKHLHLIDYWRHACFEALPFVERVDVIYMCGARPFRCALPSARVLTLQGIYTLRATVQKWVSGEVLCRYPSLQYLMFTGQNAEHTGENLWSAHDFIKVITTLASDTMPRLKYAVFRCTDPDCLKFPDGRTQDHQEGWRFYSAPAGELERLGILRPLPQVVAQDSCRDHKWRLAGHIKDSCVVDGRALRFYGDDDQLEATVRRLWALVGIREGY